MHVRYLCPYDRLTGYGRAARDNLAALDAVGIDLDIVVLGDRGSKSPEPRYAHLDRYARLAEPLELAGAAEPDVVVVHAPPLVLAKVDNGLELHGRVARRRGGRVPHVAITAWEQQPLPVEHVSTLERYDAVIVPSEFCATLFEHAAVEAWGSPGDFTKGDIHLVPHGFDEDFWSHVWLESRPPASAARNDKYRFYSIGAWSERKNMLGVIKAYLHAFTKRDQVQLVIICDGCDFDEVRSLLARSGLPASELPELYVPDKQLTEAELLELHVTADCFVTATRGEGFGLGMFEAAIMGRDVIAPLWGGQADFLDDYHRAHGVPYFLTPCIGMETRGRVVAGADGQLMQVSTVGLPPGVDCKQLWAEPDLEAMAQTMRNLYELRAQPRDAVEDLAGRHSLERTFGYDNVGHMLADKLREIMR